MANTHCNTQEQGKKRDSSEGESSTWEDRQKIQEAKRAKTANTSFPEGKRKDHAPKDSGSKPITEDDEDLGRHARNTQVGNTLHSSSRDKRR